MYIYTIFQKYLCDRKFFRCNPDAQSIKKPLIKAAFLMKFITFAVVLINREFQLTATPLLKVQVVQQVLLLLFSSCG